MNLAQANQVLHRGEWFVPSLIVVDQKTPGQVGLKKEPQIWKYIM